MRTSNSEHWLCCIGFGNRGVKIHCGGSRTWPSFKTRGSLTTRHASVLWIRGTLGQRWPVILLLSSSVITQIPSWRTSSVAQTKSVYESKPPTSSECSRINDRPPQVHVLC